MKKLSIGIQTFSKLIEEDLVYVDKTKQIYNLINGLPYRFLSRPRRFGKSLLLSTLKEIFSGNKKLFKNLWIGTSDYDWQEYPVVHLDFSTMGYSTPAELEESLNLILDDIIKKYALVIPTTKIVKIKFKLLIEQLSKKNKVVLLIDEYDKPILDHIKDIPLAEEIRTKLKEFYDALKGMDASIHKIFVTGITKFTKTSIFSGINNLDDISIYPEAADLLGYTLDEIKIYFKEHLNHVAQQNKTSVIHELENMTKWYNGYRFSDLSIKVYNPFSVLHYLHKAKLRNYWFISGTPSFLIQYVKTQYPSLEEMSRTTLTPEDLDVFEIDNIPLTPLLFQAGYLTISDYNPSNDSFELGFPNYEVESSFKKFMVATLSGTQSFKINTLCKQLLTSLEHKNIEKFCSVLKTLFAHIPSILHIAQESYYHSLFQFLLSLLSLESQSEMLTNKGRIDCVIITEQYVYIFELKLNTDSKKAIEQILSKKYYERFMGIGKLIILVGLSFKTTEPTFDIEYSMQEMPNV